MCPVFLTTVSLESSIIEILDQLLGGPNKGEGLPEGLHGREGWRSILSGGTSWVEESWVLWIVVGVGKPVRA
jgi:hypothetical protein